MQEIGEATIGSHPVHHATIFLTYGEITYFPPVQFFRTERIHILRTWTPDERQPPLPVLTLRELQVMPPQRSNQIAPGILYP
ncbi:hypothetical protein ACWD5R_05695 [Streptomyces sp. NPDC002514]|uniref:hypothetical protein n=1 Tax=Streptomyces sp. NPDC001270 TaxID=3364554 RepID=UPI0036859D2C